MSYGEGYRDGREEGYDRAVRAVVAAQWAVACALLIAERCNLRRDIGAYADGWFMASDEALRKVAALPTAEQVVDGAG